MTPLTPADCDLRGLDFMPLYGVHLFGSEFNARVSDAGWRAAVTLWWAAWNQVPAASLPNDDAALTRLADLGRDTRAFAKIKAEALHGFELADDGRLYHRALAQWALEVWDKRQKERARKAHWRAGHGGSSAPPGTGTTPPEDGDTTRTGRGQDAEQARDGTSPERGHPTGQNGHGTRMSPLKGSKGVDLRYSSMNLTTATSGEKIPEKHRSHKRVEPWWKDRAAVLAEGEKRGITPRVGESHGDFLDRVMHAVKHPRSAP